MLSGIEGGVNWGKVGNCILNIAYGASDGYVVTHGGTWYLGPYAVATGAFYC